MDITVELPADPQRLVTASRVIYRRGRLASRTLGVFAIVLGAGLLATVLLADGDGFELLLGAAMAFLGVALFRRYDRAIALGVARRPVYVHSGWPVALALPAASLGPTQAEELGAFLSERALLPAAA